MSIKVLILSSLVVTFGLYHFTSLPMSILGEETELIGATRRGPNPFVQQYVLGPRRGLFRSLSSPALISTKPQPGLALSAEKISETTHTSLTSAVAESSFESAHSAEATFPDKTKSPTISSLDKPVEVFSSPSISGTTALDLARQRAQKDKVSPTTSPGGVFDPTGRKTISSPAVLSPKGSPTLATSGESHIPTIIKRPQQVHGIIPADLPNQTIGAAEPSASGSEQHQ